MVPVQDRDAALHISRPSPIAVLTIASETHQISYPMARFLFTLLLATASLVAGQTATCLNEVAIYNQQDRTMTASMSVFSLSPKI